MNNAIPPGIKHLLSLAASYKKDGKIDDAFLKYEEAVEFLLIMGNEYEAKEIYKQITSFDPNQFKNEELKKRHAVFINITNAKRHYDHGRIDEFFKILEETKKEYLSNPEVFLNLGMAYEQCNQKEKAAENYLAVAHYYYNYQSLKKAHTFAQKAKSLNPKQNDVKILLSEIYIKEDLKEEARKELIDLVKNSIHQNALDEALRYVQRAIQVDGVETLYLEGIIWFRKGLLEAAEQKFKLVNRLKGNHFGSLCYLGEIYIKQNLPEQAFKVYQKAFSLRPWDSHIYHKLAEIHLQKENPHFGFQEKSKVEATNNFGSSKIEESLLLVDTFDEQISPKREPYLEELQTYLIESEYVSQQDKSLVEIIALYEFVVNLDPTNEEIKKKLQAIETLQKEKKKLQEEASKKLIAIEKNFNNEFWPLNIIEIAEFPSLTKEVISLYRSLLEKDLNSELLNRLNKIKLGYLFGD